MTVLDVLVKMGEKERLYRGIMDEFKIDREGGLSEIVLTETFRAKFGKKEDGSTLLEWVKIPGDRFFIPYHTVINYNVTLIEAIESDGATV